ncbi:MAG: MipA/OmpV family protein [Pseudomonas sp.]|uniref:MipA/OmpV family protein n=1 Tax=Pseudomonas TaxID=286 RepID=UPI00102FFAB8|nr:MULTISPECIES: MipA/OmpV family protein [Pseudomonas]MBO5394158.1 MipA/OmpV family protein [Pseudomonas sp.]MDN5390810.1 MipA/OmpV family protein [Pseudomonas sp.]MDN5393481.1 MipA/OmpV family protein [Pseudomonas sp.]MDN5405082.1 MipA/OmpV family protein [Pseudomonas sp.]MDN5448366.1 MipA/OmpV family protein [Pseudomonas sp.]
MKTPVCAFLLLTLLGVSAAAHAADGPSGEVGMGIGYQPYDPSASRYQTVPLPYFDVDWGDVSLNTDDGLTWSAFKAGGWSAGPVLNYVSGRNANGSLRGLRDVSDMAMLGGFVQYSPADFWRVYAQLGQAVGGAGGQGGVLGQVGGELGYPLGLGIIGSSQLAVHFADGRQMSTFFGVSDSEAQASGISAYKASGGLQNVTLTQNFEFPLTANWSLVTSASWTRLLRAAADSSIVREQGNVNQGAVQTAVSYKF